MQAHATRHWISRWQKYNEIRTALFFMEKSHDRFWSIYQRSQESLSKPRWWPWRSMVLRWWPLWRWRDVGILWHWVVWYFLQRQRRFQVQMYEIWATPDEKRQLWEGLLHKALYLNQELCSYYISSYLFWDRVLSYNNQICHVSKNCSLLSATEFSSSTFPKIMLLLLWIT